MTLLNETAPAPQVLVVGAGPVGLSAAHELARHGVRVRLVDAAAGPATTSRALATHARTLETYDQMGILDELLPRGQRVEHFTLHQNGRRLIRFDTDYSRLPTRFPFTLMVDQVITEEVLRTATARRGVEVEWGCASRSSRTWAPKAYGPTSSTPTARPRPSRPTGWSAPTEATAPSASSSA